MKKKQKQQEPPPLGYVRAHHAAYRAVDDELKAAAFWVRQFNDKSSHKRLEKVMLKHRRESTKHMEQMMNYYFGPPELEAKWTKEGGLKVYCIGCRAYHFHGPASANGLVGAHCWKDDSPYRLSGYILKVVDDS